jgi:AmmeMemoRadiSam system protein B
MIRQPAVAGTFYSASPDLLRKEVAGYCHTDAPRRSAIAVISPHAGLRYSGHVAGAVFGGLILPEIVIMIGPNHTGLGPPVSIYPEGSWLIPGGEIPVARTLATELLTSWTEAASDTMAHRLEHCLEVQLPFLQHAAGNEDHARPPHILPIVLKSVRDHLYHELGFCLADLIERHIAAGQHPPLLLASTDMNHYEPDAVTRTKDAFALDAIRNLDPVGLAEAVRTRDITMCGFGPTMTVLYAARRLGATTASLASYATSGDVTGDLTRVVGYAGFLIR